MKYITVGIGLVVLAGGLSGCTTLQSDIIGEWSLLSYGEATNQTLALPTVNTSIQFQRDHSFHGNVGCNDFGGDWKLTSDGHISFSNIVSTEMYCEDTWEQETAVLGLLSQNAQLELRSDDTETMTLTNGTSAVTLAAFIQATGTIRYIDLEGGFYGIVGDDQEHYDPLNLPEAYQKDNMSVKFTARMAPDQASFHMWGKLIYILEIEARGP